MFFFGRYITYSKEDEAIRCIQSVHGFVLDGRSLKYVQLYISEFFSWIICFKGQYMPNNSGKLQGMLWDHKILSCVAEKCGMVHD